MKIFVAFGYRPEDAWVKTLVIPMIQAFGSEAVTGETLWGGPLAGQINTRIRESHALIAFLTRRDVAGNTHPWVLQEAGAARQANLKVLEVWETGLVDKPAMNADSPYINLDPTKRDECIAEIARALIEWHSSMNEVRPYLVPQDVLTEIRKMVSGGNVQCFATLMNGTRQRPAVPVQLIRDVGGTCVLLENVRRGDMVQLKVVGPGGIYESPFTPVNSLQITMEKL
jgi:hypothetical protein